MGIGKRPFLVTEERALHELFRNGGAIHDNERLFLPSALHVYRAGGKLLPGAAFPANENRRVGLRDFLDPCAQIPHEIAFAEECSKTPLRLQSGPEPFQLT